MRFKIIRNDERYGDTAKEGPKEVMVDCNVEQARFVADRLTDYFPGC